MWQDANSILYILVTKKDFEENTANKFLSKMSAMIYDMNKEFKSNP